MTKYFGKYVDFELRDKADAGSLMGSDNIIGDVYDVEVELDDGKHVAWLRNRFDHRVMYLGPDISRKLSLLAAEGLVNRAILSFVAFTNDEDGGRYWGQVALVSYNPAYREEFEKYIKGVSAKIAEDIRPRVDFENDAADKIIESGGEWLPTQTVSLPSDEKGMSILKRRRQFKDQMVEQGRAGNIGCHIISWIIILAVVALVVFGLKSCMGW